MPYSQLLAPIKSFLHCETPDAWITEAKKAENLPIILRDHLACELKAGQTAMYLIRKYAVDKESASVLFSWFKPYEDFLYRKKAICTPWQIKIIYQSEFCQRMIPYTAKI